MKLTTKKYVIGGVGILVLAGIIGVITNLGVVLQFFQGPPPPHTGTPPGSKDTPVVVVGGSIRPKVAPTDTDGWTEQSQYKVYTAAARATTAGSAVGIDLLTFCNFDQYPDPLSNTGGWSITYADHNPDLRKTKHPNALKICSDKDCSASALAPGGATNPSVCPKPSTFSADGPIYVFAGDRARIEPISPGNKITELHFHDIHAKCDGPSGANENAKCDKIYDVLVETCKQGSLPPLTCNNANGKCNVTIGQ